MFKICTHSNFMPFSHLLVAGTPVTIVKRYAPISITLGDNCIKICACNVDLTLCEVDAREEKSRCSKLDINVRGVLNCGRHGNPFLIHKHHGSFLC